MPQCAAMASMAARTSFLSPRPHGAMAPSSRDLDVVGYDLPGVEVPGGAQSLAGRAGAMRRIEGEGARRHLGHADAAVDAGELAREQAVAAVEGVDDDDAVGQVERGLDRLGQPALDARPHDQPVDHDVDGVVLPAVERQVVVEALELAVDARLGEAAGRNRLQLLLELALPPTDDRRQHVDPAVLGIGHHQVDDPLEGLAGDLPAAVRAVRHADIGEERAAGSRKSR